MAIRMAARLFASLFVLMLFGCGGGGGGGGGGGSGGITVLSLSGSAVSVRAREDQPTPIDSSIRIVIRNLPDDGVFVEMEFSENGISSADFFQISDSEAILELKFKAPSDLAPGAYVDQVRVRACDDENCRSLVSGSPVSLQVSYTVEPATTMTLDRSSVLVGTIFGGQTPTVESVHISLDTVPADGVFVSISLRDASEVPSIESAELVELSPTERRVDIRWKDPDELGVSAQFAQILVEACYDSPCTSRVIDGSQTIFTRYRVSQFPIAATRTFDLGARDMVFDPVSGLIYMVLPSTAPAHPDTLSAFDPVAGVITASVPAGSEPKLVAVSDDGSKVYVGLSGSNQVKRFSAPDLTRDLRITLPQTGMPHLVGADQLAVAPGAARTVAVSDEGQIAIYDDATRRTGPLGPSPANTVEWGETDRILYSSDNQDTGFNFWVVDVGPLGAQKTAGYSGLLGGFSPRIHYAGGLIYSDLGAVIDPAAGSVVGTLFPQGGPVDDFRRLALDADARFAFMVVANSSDLGYVRRIEVFDMDTYAAVRTFEIEITDSQAYPERLLRWGDNKMAMLTSKGQVVIFQDPRITGTTAR